MRIQKSGNDMKFFDLNNTDGKTLTELAAAGGGSASPEYWMSPSNGVIYATGSVGIGTTTARSKLHVFGNGQTTAAITDAGDRGSFIRISHNDNTQGSGGGILFTNYQGDNANSVGFAAIKGLLYDGSGNTTGDLAVSTRSSTSSTSLTERLRITHDGKIGIGNTSPGAALDVSKSNGIPDIRLSHAGTAYMNLYGGSGVGALTLLAVQSEPLVLGTANAEKMRITSGGNVGIGTAVPDARLHIGSSGYGGSSPALKLNHAAGSGYGYAQFGDSSTNTQNWHVGSEGDGSFRWYSGNWGAGTEIMRINSAGSVGVGTSNPVNKLHVVGSLRTDGTGNSYVVLDGSSDGSYLQLNRGGSATQNAFVSQYQGQLLIKNLDSGPIVFTNTTSDVERVRIDTSGNVGIGTSSISSRLHVSGSGTGTTTTLTARHGIANGSSLPVLNVQNSVGDSLLYVSGSGFVGIGTSTASSITNLLKSLGGNVVSISGPYAASLLFEVNAGLSGSISTSNSGMVVVAGSNRTLGLGSDNGVKLSIDTDGDVNLQASDRYFDASIASGQGLRLRSSPGNSDAQVLDAYYEADLSPGIDCTGNEGNGVYVLNAAYDTLKMTRVGRLVTIGGDLRIDSLGDTPSGRLYVVLGTSPGQYPSMDTAASVYMRGATDLSSTVATSVQAFVEAGTNIMYIDGFLDGTYVQIASQIGAGVIIKVSVTYVV
jgi:hypothetical protein